VTKRRVEFLFTPGPAKITAKGIVAAERRDHEEKTARLRAARKAKEQGDLLVTEPAEPPGKAAAPKRPK
jgi:hypothetical protein